MDPEKTALVMIGDQNDCFAQDVRLASGVRRISLNTKESFPQLWFVFERHMQV